MQKLLNSKYFLLLTFTAITSCFITPKASIAATFAFSEAGFRFDNFSVSPKDVETFADTNIQAINFSSQGKANADAEANANFTSIPNLPLSFANNLSSSIAMGEGKDYFGSAESVASVTGYNFQVAPEGIFSFDFTGFLVLLALADDPTTEYASADGEISLQLYDQDNGVLLDSLSIQGNTATSNNLSFLTQNKTDNFSFIPTDTSFDTDFNGINKYAIASVKGKYSRKLAAGANLSLFELKNNRVRVAVPEPTSQLALVFGAISILLIVKRERKLLQNKITIK
ncbi:hypothetical protein DSM106972_087870 [Dulcicalothrix desertica PCC 7102]|uniref:PEP-CTERM protein-sorting domain-containing protein n=1 Tax=Dulcicalothrix desertica PCC 7102 TaxID=232991 RepID=A0A3S1BX11_9CYAN|nr:hypothetical protein [Dulcicalothrix desertica]RUS96245.1 hypothetical protein DSM106972_087870 [Dulcicalothrix desertica PCC 7102]TWH40430.1 putative secreted protein with PEP-CTERM sorting signal [Dulcicalothrix desertica PCC 7102]